MIAHHLDDNSTRPEPRLGIIISMFPELHETFILRELVALEKRGVEFDIYSLQCPRDPITLDDAIRLSSERSYYSPLISKETLAALCRTIWRHPVKLLSAVAKLIVKGRDRPTDIVKNLAILPLSLHIGELGRQRGVVHWHGHWANIPTTACWFLQQVHGHSWSAAIHGEDIFSTNRFLRHKLDDALFSVVCSGYFCDHLRTRLGLAAPEKIHLNYHGLDPRVMQYAPEAQFPERDAGTPLKLISIGRLVPTKGHDVLIRACGQLHKAGYSFSLQLIGSGPLEDELKALAVMEGVEEYVQFRGALAFDEVLADLCRADVFCLAPRLIPGHPPDGIPNVIAEAMALGIPVLTTRVSAIPELVSDRQTGLLVSVDDTDSFARCLIELAQDPLLAKQLSEQASRRVAELFDQSKNIDELLGYFRHYIPECLPISEQEATA